MFSLSQNHPAAKNSALSRCYIPMNITGIKIARKRIVSFVKPNTSLFSLGYTKRNCEGGTLQMELFDSKCTALTRYDPRVSEKL